MGWNEIVGQQRPVQVLSHAVASGRIAQAYLFHGPDGTGKRAVALMFARALQCTNRDGAPCDACEGCRKVGRMLHPDVHVMFPHPKDASSHDIADRLVLLGQQPYMHIDYVRRPSLRDPGKVSNKQSFYSVKRINEELKRVMGYRPHEGRYKVAVLIDAELFRVEAANAFLKMLEEPGANTVFILTSKRPDRLLPTILSRCQRLRFDALPSGVIESAMIEKEQVEPDRAGALARMANGSYSRALELAGNIALNEQREQILIFLRMVYSNHIDQMMDNIEQMQRMGREQIKGMLNLMQVWIRDLVLYREWGDGAPIVNVDHLESIQRFCHNLPDADLAAMSEQIEEAIHLVERNVNLSLILNNLTIALHRAMQGRPVSKLFTPLAEPILVESS